MDPRVFIVGLFAVLLAIVGLSKLILYARNSRERVSKIRAWLIADIARTPYLYWALVIIGVMEILLAVVLFHNHGGLR